MSELVTPGGHSSGADRAQRSGLALVVAAAWLCGSARDEWRGDWRDAGSEEQVLRQQKNNDVISVGRTAVQSLRSGGSISSTRGSHAKKGT